MTIGTGTFNPQAKFWMTRSKVYGINFATYAGNTVTFAGFSFTVHAVPPDPTFLHCAIAPEFYIWNSNSYSLDYVVTEFWYKAGGVGPEIPLPFSLGYFQDPLRHSSSLYIQWSGTTPTFNYFPLPSQPPNYWMPKPLP
jgi:hypothetical protein